jgi:hypothetical protein
MTIEEEMNQIEGLGNAILRLCNEADSNLIIINALLTVLVRISKESGFTPTDTIKVVAFYIYHVADEKTKKKIAEMKLISPEGMTFIKGRNFKL